MRFRLAAVLFFSTLPFVSTAALSASQPLFFGSVLTAGQIAGAPGGAHAAGTLTYSEIQQALDIRLSGSGLASAAIVHIHRGRFGERGAVVIEKRQPNVSDSTLTAEASIPATLARMLTMNDHYIDVHDEEGVTLMRGQLSTINPLYSEVGGELTGEREFPGAARSRRGFEN